MNHYFSHNISACGFIITAWTISLHQPSLNNFSQSPCRETYSTIKMLVLNIDKMYLFWQYNIYYCMHTVCRAALKNDSVCIRKGTWTDGPAPAGPHVPY